MKAYIVHGWDGNPNEPMLQWLKSSLEARDWDVMVPAMPDSPKPKIDAWVEKLVKTIVLDENTFLIGHSIGCQAILRYAETLPPGKTIKRIILIAPWMELNKKTLKKDGKEARAIAKPWMTTPIDFAKVKGSTERIVAIFSDNDPDVPLEQKDLFEKELGAQIVIEKHKGHFTEGDGIKMLPSALNAALA